MSGRRELGSRGIAPLIAAMILLMIVVTAGVLFYSYSSNLLGRLQGANPPVTMDNLRIEAYNWQSLGTLVLNVRNVGANVLTMSNAQSSAQWFVAGVLQTQSGCSGTLSPGVSCAATITITGVTVSNGFVYVVKVVLSDGAIFSASAIAGEVTGQTGVT